MKKLYSLLFAVTGLSVAAVAQCVISSATVTPSGLTVSATMTASGAVAPTYVWSWGDSQTSSTQTATHTYASAGTYTVCAAYVDATNFNCFDSTCQVITVTATGINDPANPKADISTSPNPFANNLNISFALFTSDNVMITVMDITGKQVAILQNGTMAAGNHNVIWDPADADAGVYFVQVKAGNYVHTRKVMYTGGK